MLTKILVAGFSVLMFSTALSAYDLKTNMHKLNAELEDVRQGFMISNKEVVREALTRFSKSASDLLSNKDKIEKLLPKDKAYKANIAVNASFMIEKNVAIIDEMIENKYNQSQIRRKETAQQAFLDIERACMNCHNLVRDW